VEGQTSEGWDAAWRLALIDRAAVLVNQLWEVGIEEIYLDGSFVYPHFGQLSGIRDRHGHDLMFPAAFRLQRNTDAPKGIIQVAREEGTP